MDIRDVKVDRIYPVGHDRQSWKACGIYTYGKNSVREGETQEVPVEWFDTLDEARAKYPEAEVVDYEVYKQSHPPMADSAPSWFDPANAGESWSEE